MTSVRAIVIALVALLVTAPSAAAVYGENFGVGDVNVPGAEAAPAFPGSQSFWAGTCDLFAAAPVAGISPEAPRDCIDFGVANTTNSLEQWASPPEWRLAPNAEAGTRTDGTTVFWLRRNNEFAGPFSPSDPDGSLRNARVGLPAGFVADTTAVPHCPAEAIRQLPPPCDPASQVGIVTIYALPLGVSGTDVRPIYLVEPRRGKPAELVIADAFDLANPPALTAEVRTTGDFGVDVLAEHAPTAFPLIGIQVTIWGVPWAASHNRWRPVMGSYLGAASNFINGLPVASQQPYDPSWGPIKPFLSNPSECAPSELTTGLAIDSWQAVGQFKTYGSEAPAATECDKLPFEPAATFRPTSEQPDTASGLVADITIPDNDDPPPAVAADPDDATGAPAHWKSDAGRATAQLDKTVVTLPAGMAVNPSSATGLEACTDAQMGVTAVGNPYLFDDAEPDCPDGAKIGTVEAKSPILAETLTGEVILGEPKSTDPRSGQMLRLFLVVRNKERGLLAKVHGSAVADPDTGQLTATFDKNPRVPVERVSVHLKGGGRGVLALPQSCGTKTTSSTFTPWTSAHGGGGVERLVADSFAVAGDCSFGFVPELGAGMSASEARGGGTFSFRFSRRDGEQWLRGLTAKLPQGLLASVKDVPLCSNAAADAGDCPAGSKIGIVDARAGSGDPFVLEQKGEVFLTEGYKGGEYGLAVKIRPIAGPFRGAMELSPIVVRQAIHVDRTTAQVTAVSDPFPLIHHGVPLRVREVTVIVDRRDFMLNPSDCAEKRVRGSFVSAEGAGYDRVAPFRASNCAALPFRPRLALRLTGRRQVTTGTHPGVRAVVRQSGVGEAGIQKAIVRLPKSLALDPDNAQALCEFEDGIEPDLENHCPEGSIVGRARAVSPLLKDPLVGDVYFVKNVRIDKRTGNAIRTLPMIVVALRGEIAVNLRGVSSTTKGGKLVNTFAEVPDAPISRFNLNIAGGEKGILVVTRTRRSLIDLCAKPKSHVAEADMDGHNGKRRDFDVRMKAPCTTRQTRAAKRRAAARRR